jgi:hypothetical protein
VNECAINPDEHTTHAHTRLPGNKQNKKALTGQTDGHILAAEVLEEPATRLLNQTMYKAGHISLYFGMKIK